MPAAGRVHRAGGKAHRRLTEIAAETMVEIRPSKRRRIGKIALWLVGLGLFWLVLQLLGVDVKGWLEQFRDELQAIPTRYTVSAVLFQTGEIAGSGLAYYGILRAAYKDEVGVWPVLAAYSVGIAMNGFLPASTGTWVTLVMFVAIIPSCTIGGAIAVYVVHQIFYTLAATFVYLYMFLSVPGSFELNFGRETRNPGITLAILTGAVVLIVLLVRIFWRKAKKFWAEAKEGGVILTTPKRYLSRVFLPSLLGWLCKVVVTGIFLAAFAIPVTFESIMWVFGSGTLASVVSFTPGAIGITQATNSLALETCCNVPTDVAINYSTAQQLILTAWNQLIAIVLVVWVFGWSGGKQLVAESYADAKVKAKEAKGRRKRKKQQEDAA
jgi:uncharacterized membrane protein YbhN (UPF0104 family)